MKKILIVELAFVALWNNTSLADSLSSPAELIKAATTRPWPGENFPTLPSVPTEMRGLVANEINSSPAINDAYLKLDAAGKRNVDWFEGVTELERHKAVWSLLSCSSPPIR